jgi:hypothetical protein
MAIESLHKLPPGESGAIGYMLLWLMGIPASVLFLLFLVRGCT